jgi:resuscitation-promoting factor RpfB
MPGRINGFSLAYTATGAIVLWSGIRGWTISQTFRSLLSGTTPSASTEPIATGSGSTDAGAALQGDLDTGTSIPGVTSGVPAGVAASGTPAVNIATGELMAAGYGWTGDNWLCLKTGWQEESGWNQYAANDPSDPYDHAYGIPQANPGTKMASAGSNWETSPVTQISWGLAYIKDNYGSPSQVPGWTPTGPAPGYQGY